MHGLPGGFPHLSPGAWKAAPHGAFTARKVISVRGVSRPFGVSRERQPVQ